MRLRPLPAVLRAWAALAVLLAVAAAAPAPAQSPAETAAALVQRTYAAVRDDALVPSDPGAVLRSGYAAVAQALQALGADSPPPPPLVGIESEDLRAFTGYLAAALRAAGPGLGERITAQALRGLIRPLGDRWSAVFLPAEFSAYLAELRGETGRIGVQVDYLAGQIVITELVADGPAARAGLRPGDVLLEINFFPVIGRRPDEVLAMLRGRPGSVIEIAVRRPDGERRLPVTRQLVREIPTRARTLETGIGYIRLLEFSEDASQDFQRALGRLTAQGARALVLDLRDNGGGLVDEAVLVASALLSPGPVAIEETRRGQLIVLVRPVAQRFSGPIVVLVNHHSASSSEIVAGALQDAGATLIGEKTFGKGTVQSIYALAAGWGLRLTTARYLTPKRRPIDGVGLLPELAVVSPADQVTGLGDFQLETARVLARRRLSAVGAGR